MLSANTAGAATTDLPPEMRARKVIRNPLSLSCLNPTPQRYGSCGLLSNGSPSDANPAN
jgi:hypothetical protein